MFALILDSLGSTELLFILVIALMFFGPRKLPQLSRSIGRSLAEFRKASEDFKRTWEREVALESARAETTTNSSLVAEESALTDPEGRTQFIQEPSVSPVPAEHVIARQSAAGLPDYPLEQAEHISDTEPSSKREWL